MDGTSNHGREAVTHLAEIATQVTSGTGVTYVVTGSNPPKVTPVFKEGCNTSEASRRLSAEANRRVSCHNPTEYLTLPGNLTPEEETLVLSLLTLSLETYAGNPKFPWVAPLTWDIPNGPPYTP